MASDDVIRRLTESTGPRANPRKPGGAADLPSDVADALEALASNAGRRPDANAVTLAKHVGDASPFPPAVDGDEPEATSTIVEALRDPWTDAGPDPSQERLDAAAFKALACEEVRLAVDEALRRLRDCVDGAVAAIVASVSSQQPAALGTEDVAHIQREVEGAIARRGAAEFHSYVARFEDSWRATVGPIVLDVEGAISLMEVSARARYDTAEMSAAAFFESVTARLTGSTRLAVDDVGSAWAGGSVSGSGIAVGAFLGFDGAGGHVGVTSGRAEALAGIEVLGRRSQIGVGVSAGFELGLQLSASVSVRLGPFAASVPNLPVATVTCAASALADMVTDPSKTAESAVEDIIEAVVDVGGFFLDLAEQAADLGESVMVGIGQILWQRHHDEVLVTQAETASEGAVVEHYESFEGDNSTWIFGGSGGIDVDQGYAARGRNNAWLRGSDGVHTIARFFDVRPRARYTLSMRMRTSETPVNLVIGTCEAPDFGAQGAVITEDLRRVHHPRYSDTRVDFTTGDDTVRVLVYVGLVAGSRNVWCQIDDVQLVTDSTVID